MKDKVFQSHITPLIAATLLKLVNRSLGTAMFRTFYAEVGGDQQDVTKDGRLSCAFYVSSLLAVCGLLDRAHTTVNGTVRAMKENGWRQTRKLTPGVVIVWDKPIDGSHDHRHIGFYVGPDRAISNSPIKRTPVRHHITFGREGGRNYRPVVAIYTHSDLK